MLNYSADSKAEPNWATAIDVALLADVTTIRHALVLDKRLSEPRDAQSLDAAYHLRLTTLQCYVDTAALLDVYAAADAVLNLADPASWELTAVGYEAVENRDGSAVVSLLVRPDEAWLRMQHQLIFGLVPHFASTGTEESFVLNDDDSDFDPRTIENVARYVPRQTGPRFRPSLDVGVGSAANARAIAAEPFEPFTFRPAGAAIYHLGCDVSARVRLKSWAFSSEGAELNPVSSAPAWNTSQVHPDAQTFRHRLRLLGL